MFNPHQALIATQRRERFDRLAPIYQSRGVKLRPPEDDPPSFEVGYRQFDQDGNRLDRPIPMSRADALHPWEGDKLATSRIHALAIATLFNLARAKYRLDPSFVWIVNMEFRIGKPDYSPIRTDFAFLLGVVNQRNIRNTVFHLDREPQESIRCPLVVEVTSPSTRENDFVDKVVMYNDSGFEQYIVIDIEDHGIGFYEFLPGLDPFPCLGPRLDRVLIRALGLWMSSQGHNLLFTNSETGEVVADYPQALQELQELRRIADTERARADAAETLANSEKQQKETLQEAFAQFIAKRPQSFEEPEFMAKVQQLLVHKPE